MLAPFMHHCVEQIIQRHFVSASWAARPARAWRHPSLTVHLQQGSGVMRSSSLVKKGIDPSVLDCKRWISLTLSCRVRLPATQAGTTLVMGANAIHTHVSP